MSPDDNLETPTAEQLPPELTSLAPGLAHCVMPTWAFDLERSRIAWANAAAVTFWRAGSTLELSERDFSDGLTAQARERFEGYIATLPSVGQVRDTWTLSPAGEAVTIEFDGRLVTLDDGQSALLIQVLSEVTLSEHLRGLTALNTCGAMVSVYSRDGELLYANPAARANVGDAIASLRNRFRDVADYESCLGAVKDDGGLRVERRVRTREGTRWHDIDIRTSLDADSGELGYTLTELDVTDRRQAEQHIGHLIRNDGLTGLLNRQGMMSALQEILLHRYSSGRCAALLVLDLDRFRVINDGLGMVAGDEVLMETARRIAAILPEDAKAARISGDEFAVMVPELGGNEEARKLAESLLEVLGKPIKLREHTLRLSAGAGICLFPTDTQDPQELLRQAELALYQSKQAGYGAVRFFAAPMTSVSLERMLLESEMHEALRSGQFALAYQPRISLDNPNIVGVEALVRWHHPQRGLLMPATFIPLAEHIGLVGALSDWVLRESARQLRIWQQAGFDFSVSVNLSAQQFQDDGIVAAVERAAEAEGVSPDHFELEITESMLMGDTDSILATLQGLRDRGIGLAVDDFGTGYSNLAYLQRYPIQCLKLDKSFVHDTVNPGLAETILAMSRLLDLRVVAEGVETPEQFQWLSKLGCDEYQGNLFSPPVDAVAITELLAAGQDVRPTF